VDRQKCCRGKGGRGNRAGDRCGAQCASPATSVAPCALRLSRRDAGEGRQRRTHFCNVGGVLHGVILIEDVGEGDSPLQRR
jgi:hypothetical protein